MSWLLAGFPSKQIMWSTAIAGNMEEKVPNIRDIIDKERSAKFDNSLAKVIARALEKNVEERLQTPDEMHEAVYSCLVVKGEALYGVFI